MSLRDRIKRHEGKRLEPYKDSVGLLTVGYGRCIDRVPFSEDEIELMFRNDLRRARAGARSFHFYPHIGVGRQEALTELCFWLGLGGVKKFKKMLSALSQGRWRDARDELLDSKLHTQVPARCEELADILLTGETNENN